MAEKKKRSPMPRRFRYAELYRAEPKVNASGKLATENVYIGPYLLPSHGEDTYRRVKTVSLLCAVVNALCLVLLMSVNGFFFYTAGKYVMIPLAACLIPAAYLLFGAFRPPPGGQEAPEGRLPLRPYPAAGLGHRRAVPLGRVRRSLPPVSLPPFKACVYFPRSPLRSACDPFRGLLRHNPADDG